MSRSTPRPIRDRQQPLISRNTIVELARIYVASAAYGAALEALERLPVNGWDEEARLLRSEALLGSGSVADAMELLGPIVLPPPSRTRVAGARSVRRETGRVPLSRRRRLDLWRFLLQLRGLHRQGQSRRVVEIGRAYFQSETEQACSEHARIAMVVGQAMLACQRPADARELFEHVRDLFDRLGSAEGLADALLAIGNTHLLDCHWDEADALYQEVRFRYEEIGLSEKALAASINLGVLRVKRGELDSGRHLLTQSLRRAVQLGSTRRRPSILLGLAMAEIRSGRDAEARHHLAEVIRDARRNGARRNLALALEFAGELHLRRGRLALAERSLNRALVRAESLAPDGDISFEVKRRLAEVALDRGEAGRARVLATDAVRGAQRFGDAYEAAAAERVLAAVDLEEGAFDSAATRAAAAGATLDRLGETYERSLLSLLQLRIRIARGEIPLESLRRELRSTPHAAGFPADSPVGRGYADLLRRVPSPERGASPGRTDPGETAVTCIALHPEPLRGGTAGPRNGGDWVRIRGPQIQPDDLREVESLGLVTRNPEMLRVLALARRVAELDVPVVIRGESGAGCEILARLLHRWSGRPGPYIPFHCMGLTVTDLRRELFGRGAEGLVAILPGGTLFLDEVAMLDAEAQDELADWLNRIGRWSSDRSIRIVGAVRSRPQERRPGQLRDLLFDSIGKVVLDLPPLRVRRGDIRPQALSFLEAARRRLGRPIPEPPADVLSRWELHSWPGNLRELRDVVERYVDREGRGADPEAG